MKTLKRFAGLLLALTLAFALTVPAMAANDGSITINGIGKGVTYSIYQLLELSLGTKADCTGQTYSYKLIGEKNPDNSWKEGSWAYFFVTTGADFGGGYVTIKDNEYVEWKAGMDGDADVAEFAQRALAYAEKHHIAAEGTYTSPADAPSYTFSGLELGYYLVDSTVGALCGLTTTDKDASINAKNGHPTIEKQVIEDSTGNTASSNSADIGQIVEFRTTVNVHAGAENYVIHDKMGVGLTFVQDLTDVSNPRGVFKIEHVIPGTGTHEVPAAKYTVKTTGLADDCTFEIVFSEAFCKEMKNNDKIVVHYNAMLNRHAIVAEDGNPNETKLTYGDGNTTTSASTKTYTYGIQIVKTEDSNKLISGAKFRIYDAATGGNEVAVVPLMNADDSAAVLDANNNPVYRRARPDETGVEIEAEDGIVTLVGFDNGTYYLEETVAPDGYSKLTARKEFTISDGNLNATFNGTVYSSGSGIHVVNKTGAMLPETGGMGTVLFVTFGMLVVLGTGVLLVTKKRMAMIED